MSRSPRHGAVVSRGQRRARQAAPGARRTPGLNRRHIGQMMVQMSDLLDAGCPLSRALEAISRQAAQKPLARLAESLHAEIVNGAPLADAMQHQGDCFTTVQVSMVRAAEAGGFLQQTLANLAANAARQGEAIRQIKAKLAYPAVLAITAVASVVFLLTYIVPRFTKVYQDARQVMPTPTRTLLAVSGFIGDYWVALLVGLAVVLVGLRAMFRWPAFRAGWDRMMLRMPVVAPVLRDWDLSRFAQTMSMLLSGGVPVLQSLRLSAQAVGRAPLREEIDRLASAVEHGEPLSGPMAASRFFDATAREMIVVSEASGKLTVVLDRLAEQRYRNFQARADALLALVEPAIILVVGALVGLTVIALLLPVLMMNTLVVG